MKTVLMAAAAAVSLAGAAFAQQPTTPDQSTTAGQQGSMPSPAPGGQGAMTPDSARTPPADPSTAPAGAPPAGSSMPQSSMPQSSMPSSTPDASGAMPASSAPMASSGMTANTPAGDAPSTYPACTKRGQDRCKSSGRRDR